MDCKYIFNFVALNLVFTFILYIMEVFILCHLIVPMYILLLLTSPYGRPTITRMFPTV